MTRVLVVGDLVADVVARLGEPVQPGSDAAAEVRRRDGGAGANAAAWLASLDVPVTFAGRVGDDHEGRDLVAALARAGVTCAVTVDPDRPTGTIVVLVAPGGERTMVTDRGANDALAPGDLPAAGFTHLHLSGYTLLGAGSRQAALAALARARALGATVSVDPASARPLALAGPRWFLDETRGCDVCLPNLDEARLLTGQTDPAAAARTLAGSYREVVVTLGPAGACWSDGDRAVQVPAAPAPVVDATGAGDAFAAGFLAARLAGADPPTALAQGTALAARAVARLGARP